MIDREELRWIREEFNIDGLVKDILTLAEGIAKAYKEEAGIKKAIRKLERDLEAIEGEMMQEAAEGRNEAQRRATLARLKAESEKYQAITEHLENLRAELEAVRANRLAAQTELNARRSICYLLGSVLDACHAQRIYAELEEGEELEEEDFEFEPADDLADEEEPPF